MKVFRIQNELNFYKTIAEALLKGAKPEDIQEVEITLSSSLKNDIYEDFSNIYLYEDAEKELENFILNLDFETEDDCWDAFEKVTGCDSEKKIEAFLLDMVEYFKNKFDCNIDENSMWSNAFKVIFEKYVLEHARENFPKNRPMYYTKISSTHIDKHLNNLEISEKIICKINNKDAIIKRIDLLSNRKEFAIYYDGSNNMEIVSENDMEMHLLFNDLKIEIDNIQLYEFISIEKLAENFIAIGSNVNKLDEILFTLDTKENIAAHGEAIGWYAIRKTNFFDSSQIVIGTYGSGSYISAEVEQFDVTTIAKQIRTMLSDEPNFNGKIVCIEKIIPNI